MPEVDFTDLGAVPVKGPPAPQGIDFSDLGAKPVSQPLTGWQADPYASFLGAANRFLKTPVASHLVGGETVSSIIERYLPARETGGVKGQAADVARLTAGLADFAGSPEGFANAFLAVATGGASVPWQATTYASVSGAEVPGLAKKYYHERTPDNLQNLLMASAFTAGLGAGAGRPAPGVKAGLEAGKAQLQQSWEALPSVPVIGKAAFEARAKGAALKATETKVSNLAAVLETGGKPPPGVRTFEDLATPYLEDIRAEASRQNVKPGHFIGRKGYGVAEKLTGNVRKAYDDGYKALVDPIRDRPASAASKQAALDFATKLENDAAFMDAITKTKNLEQVIEIRNRISSARTIGELDDARLSYNRIGAKYYGKTGEAQYEGSMIQEAMSEAAKAIREPLYNEIASNYDSLSAGEIRAFQKSHGRAIQADNLMKQTATDISSVESMQVAPHTWWGRVRGTASPLTMARPIHAVGGVIQRVWGPRDISLFNTRMRRALDKLEPSKPFKGISPGPPNLAPVVAAPAAAAPAPVTPGPVAPAPPAAVEPVAPAEVPPAAEAAGELPPVRAWEQAHPGEPDANVGDIVYINDSPKYSGFDPTGGYNAARVVHKQGGDYYIKLLGDPDKGELTGNAIVLRHEMSTVPPQPEMPTGALAPPSPLSLALKARQNAGLVLNYLKNPGKYGPASEGKAVAFVQRELGIDISGGENIPEAEAGLKQLAAGKKPPGGAGGQINPYEIPRRGEVPPAVPPIAAPGSTVPIGEAQVPRPAIVAPPEAPTGVLEGPKPAEVAGKLPEVERGVTLKARLQVRPTLYRGKTGFTVVGTDAAGRSVKIFSETRQAAEALKADILAGREVRM